jgi:uncharacterized Zn finger protein (UPF0148 family)
MTETLISCPSCGHRFAVSQALSVQLRAEVEQALRQEADLRLKTAIAEARTNAHTETAREMKLLQERLADQQQRLNQAQEAELALRKDKAALEERQRELDLEVARKLDA